MELSASCTVKDAVVACWPKPGLVGVPTMIPLWFRFRPVGKLPLDTVNISGVIPFVASIVWL
jgi:hypothetical protein